MLSLGSLAELGFSADNPIDDADCRSEKFALAP